MPLNAVFLFVLSALAPQAPTYDILATTVNTETVWTTCVCPETSTATAFSTCTELGAATLTGGTV
jgi:hypothetical protein